MTTKETLKWRLSKLPTSDEVIRLLNEKLITKEEAKDILFSTEKEEERDESSLKSEIKFLREIIEKLSNNQSTRIVEVIKEVHKPYYRYDWYQPYVYYCNAGISTLTTSGTANIYLDSTTTGSSQTLTAFSDMSVPNSFTAIKTF